jgi:hypothetical protein
MPDNVIAPATGESFATDLVNGVHWPFSKMAFGPAGTAVPLADANGQRLPVTIGGTLPAFAAPPTVVGPLTDAEMRAAPVAVSFTGQSVSITGVVPVTIGAPVAIVEPPAVPLASNVTLAAGVAGATVSGVAAGSYIFEAIFTGATLQLQRLGPDGVTWINAGVLSTSGSVGVVLAANDTLRLRNGSDDAITGIFARVA